MHERLTETLLYSATWDPSNGKTELLSNSFCVLNIGLPFARRASPLFLPQPKLPSRSFLMFKFHYLSYSRTFFFSDLYYLSSFWFRLILGRRLLLRWLSWELDGKFEVALMMDGFEYLQPYIPPSQSSWGLLLAPCTFGGGVDLCALGKESTLALAW